MGQAIEATIKWLEELGVSNVGTDDQREFGRAADEQQCSMGELCGQCAHGTLCVGPDGEVSPCIMSKNWSVGSTHVDSIADIAASEKLAKVRADIFEATNLQLETMGGCQPDNNNPCGPDSGNCNPCSPNGHCGPNSCRPK